MKKVVVTISTVSSHKETPLDRKARLERDARFGTNYSRVIDNKKKRNNKYACRKKIIY
jgi:hypothetical protein